MSKSISDKITTLLQETQREFDNFIKSQDAAVVNEESKFARDDYGVYLYINHVNNKMYCGKGNIYHRHASMLHDLRNGKHRTKYFQEDFENFGEANFSHYPLYSTKQKDDVAIRNIETTVINLFRLTDPKFGYNQYNRLKEFSCNPLFFKLDYQH
ncbi:hypothetical protein MHB77_08855 [Paenibacillus sp. FSL K6-3166]|uniref:hypothetical protein n=1 Tax=unclassified Paenibacillus TaxID=185978 RepID=UPI000BA06222|nr:hypothetical protein [Paenibacillus sp. VTT E-133291]MBY3618553.1 hypothetical protein [Acinetobacter sp. CUI P1]OZQ97268.1 hypothetical protein CA598_06845 [Paenibacillus sp. VTT E-133291]